jgi:hypothetical protein
MAAETLALVDGFDYAVSLRAELERLLHRKIPLLLLTDNEPLFHVIIRAKYTT